MLIIQNDINKFAGFSETIGTIFHSLLQSVREVWDPEHPVLSVLNFFTVGYLRRFSLIYGVLAGVLTTSGVSVEALLSKIRNLLGGVLKSNGYKPLADVEKVSNDIAMQAVGDISPPDEFQQPAQNKNIPPRDYIESLNTTLYKEMIKIAAEENELDLIKKAASSPITSLKISQGMNPVIAILDTTKADKTITKVASWALIRMLLPGLLPKAGFIDFVGWLIKTVLWGVGLVAVTGAVTDAVKKPEQLPQDTLSVPPTAAEPGDNKKLSKSLLSYIKPGNDAPDKKHENDAPDGAFKTKAEDKDTFAWMEPSPGTFEDMIRDWIIKKYPELTSPLHLVSPQVFMTAIADVKKEFASVNENNPDKPLLRVPSIYTTKKEILAKILSKITV